LFHLTFYFMTLLSVFAFILYLDLYFNLIIAEHLMSQWQG